MRYLKLFEAFESQILSKTLGFIKSSNDKNNFISILKNLCDTIDLPFSKLSDDYFEYLPFQKALEKADMTGDEPCDATSEKQFPQFSVEGAKCEGGKLKRMWGSRVREVECPVCNGTGVKPKTPRLKLLKFWFDKDGKYITTTAVDGLVKNFRGFSKSKDLRVQFSERIEDYRVVKSDLSFSQVQDLETGDIVYFENRERSSGIAYVYKMGRTYLLQNFATGSDPGDSRWQKIAPCSWVIASEGDFRRIDKLQLKSEDKKEEEVEIDPYTWNTKTNIRGSRISLLDGSISEVIKDANFAIILDFGKLEVSGFKTKSDVEIEREESKRGATAFMKPEDIKTQNIRRYLTEISKRSDLTTDISNVDKVAKRFLGGQYALFLINGDNSRFDRQFTNLITYYYSYIEEKNKGGTPEYYADRLSNDIKSTYENTSKRTNKISKSLKEIKLRLKTEKKDPIYTDIIDGMEYLSQLIYQQLSKLNLETIEDLEIFAAKIRAVREVCRSDRYKFSKLTRFFEYLEYNSSDRSYDYLVSSYYGIGGEEIEVLDSIDKMKRILIGLIK